MLRSFGTRAPTPTPHRIPGRSVKHTAANADEPPEMVRSATNGDGSRGRDEAAGLRRELDALHDTTVALSAPLDPDALLELIAERAAGLVGGSHGYVYVLSDDGSRMVERVAQGPLSQFACSEITREEGHAGLVWRTGKAQIDNDYRTFPPRRDIGQATPAAVLGAPLIVRGEVAGVLGLARTEPGATFSLEDQRLVERFAQIASLAIERVSLHAELHHELEQRRGAEEELLHTIARLTHSELALKQSHEEMVRRLASAAEQRDGATGRHIERVSTTCEQVARRLGLDDAFCEALRLASPLHDVGKIAIRDDVLLKAAPLDDEERAEIQRHAEIGHRMLCDAGSELLDLAATIALTHHERFDGTGYPQGLHGEEIPLEGRIAAIADVFDALTSDRVYRPAFPLEQALAMMRAGSGTQFDPVVLDAFLDVHQELGVRLPPKSDMGLPAAPHDPAPGVPSGATVSEDALARAVADAVDALPGAASAREAIDNALKCLCRGAGTGVIASVYTLDHDRLWCLAQNGYEQVRDGFTLQQGVMGRSLRTETIVFLPDVRTDAGFIGAQSGITSELALPLVGQNTRAILNVETVGARLPDGAVAALEPLADAMRDVIDALDAPLRLDLATLARLTVYASSLRSVAELTEFATRTLGRLLDLEAAQLTLGGPTVDSTPSFWRRPESPLQPIPNETIAAATASSSLGEYTWSMLDGVDMELAAPDEPGRWLLWLPLRIHGVLLGSLVGRSNAPIALEHEQTEAATLFAQQIAALIDVGQALRRERRAAVTDSLTGLLNPRGFDERLREEIARAERSGRTLAVVLTDCDDLKRINDRFGHERGDAVLQGIARLLRNGKRLSDVAGRVGGDEFGLLLPEADAEAVAVVTERLRLALHDIRLAGEGVTASFGIAMYPDSGRTGAALLRAADRALYEAKHGGKDRLAGTIAAG